MADDPLRRRDTSELATSPDTGATGRLGTFSLLGALAGGMPLPWVPDAVERRVRGALAQDVVARRALSLSPEARLIFAEPAGPDGPRGVVGQARKWLARRLFVRFGPLGLLPPVRAGLQTYVLGRLLARYVDTARHERAVRIDVEEARRIRRIIDHSLIHALTAELDPQRETLEAPPEDLRDDMTQLLDTFLIATAGVPSWLVRRLDAAFDDLIAEEHGGR